MRSTKLPSSIRSLLGFEPLPVPPHAFALGPERLSYGRFERQGEVFDLAFHRAVAVPPETFQEGLLGGAPREPKQLDELLGELLEGLDAPVTEASLVLPDTWLRVTFTEAGDLPRARSERQEVLRWKLKRLVPFRVDELRLAAVEVDPLPGAEARQEPLRLLLGFALEHLLEELEAAFQRAGVRLGQITSASLAVLDLLAERGALGSHADGDHLAALVMVEDDGYTLACTRGGSPVLHRHKGSAGTVAEAARGDFVERDLRLTGRFLEENFPGEGLDRVLLLAPPGEEDRWLDWLTAGLGAPVEALGERHLPLRGGATGLGVARDAPWWETVALLGAASREVT